MPYTGSFLMDRFKTAVLNIKRCLYFFRTAPHFFPGNLSCFTTCVRRINSWTYVLFNSWDKYSQGYPCPTPFPLSRNHKDFHILSSSRRGRGARSPAASRSRSWQRPFSPESFHLLHSQSSYGRNCVFSWLFSTHYGTVDFGS